MNYKNLGKILGKIITLEGILMLAPMIVALIYHEDARHILAFAIPAVALILMGFFSHLLRPKRNHLYQKEASHVQKADSS